MKVLILGAGGLLGSELTASAPQDALCHAFSRTQLDVTDPVALSAAVAAHCPDLILNAAAFTDVDRAEIAPEAAFSVKAAAIRLIAEAAKLSGAHLVHLSSDAVFDGRSSIAYRPEDQPNPLSVYGRSKAAGEDAAGPDATVVRTSWVYGAKSNNFVTTMLIRMQLNEEVHVVCDQISGPTWVRGLAETVWALGTRRVAGTWHHSDAGVASRYDLAVAIAEEAYELGLLKEVVKVHPIASS